MKTRALQIFPAIIIIAAAIALSSARLNAQPTGVWKEVPAPKLGGQWIILDFADSLNGWLVKQDSGSGEFTKTTDGGKTWVNNKIVLKNAIIAEKLYDSQNGMVVTTYADSVTRLYVTTDAGNNWSEKIFPDTLLSPLRGGYVSLLNKDMIGFISEGLYLYTSTDAGDTWRKKSLPNELSYSTMRMTKFLYILDSTDIFLGGDDGGLATGFLYRSRDGENTWGLNSWAGTIDSKFYTKSLGYFSKATGLQDDLIYYFDTELYNSALPETLITFSGNEYSVIYENREVFYVPFGSSLKKENPLANDSLFVLDSIWHQSDLHVKEFTTTGYRSAWLLADSGRVFQRVDVLTGIQSNGQRENHLSLAKDYAIISAYPNPFNGSCKIEVEAGALSRQAAVKVFDVLGRTVAQLFEGEIQPGKHNFVWNGCNSNGISVASGVYYVTVSAESFITTKSIAYIK